jgi:hypothetical protein
MFPAFPGRAVGRPKSEALGAAHPGFAASGNTDFESRLHNRQTASGDLHSGAAPTTQARFDGYIAA